MTITLYVNKKGKPTKDNLGNIWIQIYVIFVPKYGWLFGQIGLAKIDNLTK